jgi:hypothetical protein
LNRYQRVKQLFAATSLSTVSANRPNPTEERLPVLSVKHRRMPRTAQLLTLTAHAERRPTNAGNNGWSSGLSSARELTATSSLKRPTRRQRFVQRSCVRSTIAANTRNARKGESWRRHCPVFNAWLGCLSSASFVQNCSGSSRRLMRVSPPRLPAFTPYAGQPMS